MDVDPHQLSHARAVIREDLPDGAHDEVGFLLDPADERVPARDVRRHDAGDEIVGVCNHQVMVGRGARLEVGRVEVASHHGFSVTAGCR